MSSTLKAILGPTNTGKTHYAIERMTGFGTGMIGLQLSRDDTVFEVGDLNIVDGQDVRVLSTTSGSTLRHIGAVRRLRGHARAQRSVQLQGEEPC